MDVLYIWIHVRVQNVLLHVFANFPTSSNFYAIRIWQCIFFHIYLLNHIKKNSCKDINISYNDITITSWHPWFKIHTAAPGFKSLIPTEQKLICNSYDSVFLLNLIFSYICSLSTLHMFMSFFAQLLLHYTRVLSCFTPLTVWPSCIHYYSAIT